MEQSQSTAPTPTSSVSEDERPLTLAEAIYESVVHLSRYIMPIAAMWAIVFAIVVGGCAHVIATAISSHNTRPIHIRLIIPQQEDDVDYMHHRIRN